MNNTMLRAISISRSRATSLLNNNMAQQQEHHQQQQQQQQQQRRLRRSGHAENVASDHGALDLTHLDLLRGTDWATNLLRECAASMASALLDIDDLDHNAGHAQQLLWVLNELASPYGSHEQRLAWSFMHALFCRLSGSGPSTYATLCAASERSHNFETMRKTILKFQEASPWTTFGHVASNGAILEALEGESRVHIIDMSDTLCTQWPTLLEALATRAEGVPNLLRLTTVVFNQAGGGEGSHALHDSSSSSSYGSTHHDSLTKVMEEVGIRLEKFARLMGVPFQFNLVHHTDLHHLLQHEATIRQPDFTPHLMQHSSSSSSSSSSSFVGHSGEHASEALVINCVQTLHRVPPSQRHALLCTLHNLNPKIITLVEDDVELGAASTARSLEDSFSEALRFYSLFFDSLDYCMPKTSSERLALERAASRSILHIVACADRVPESSQHEIREKSSQWNERMYEAGFVAKGFSEDVFDDVKALLKRYKEGSWGYMVNGGATTVTDVLTEVHDHEAQQDHRHQHQQQRHHGFTLTWKDQAIIYASAWMPFP